MSESNHAEIEFNSMAAVLKRIDYHTNKINYARASRYYVLMLDSIIDYYKEIDGDLTEKEKEIWARLVKLKNQIYSGIGTNPLARSTMATPTRLINDLDEMDLQIRRLAKIHGYLTKQSKDVRKAIIEM